MRLISKLREQINVAWIVLRKYGLVGAARLVYSDLLFDVRKRTDLNIAVDRADLFEGKRLELQNRYVPSTFRLVDQMIEIAAEHVALDSCNFVDVGSGKGKVLVGAAKHPFRQVKGIEFDAGLAEIATRNLAKLGLDDRAASIQADATEYQFDADDRVLYFFNPFMGELLDQCLAHIAATPPNGERVLLYANPVDDDIFQRHFEKLGDAVLEPGDIGVAWYRG